MMGQPEQSETNSERFQRLREAMVAEQIEARGVDDVAVIRAMRQVPREAFVTERYQGLAYDDSPLPILSKQTISQPYVVAYMIAALQMQPNDRVLEIGTGSGYAAAVLSQIVAKVYTVERHEPLVKYARTRLARTGCENVLVHYGDGTQGWPEFAPYNGIIVAAGGPAVPASLKEQMAIGGRLVMPVGRSRQHQRLMLLTRLDGDEYMQEKLSPVAFVPLIGKEGW